MAWVDAMLRNGLRAWVTSDRFAVQAGEGRSHGPIPLVVWRRYARPADLPRLLHGDALAVFDRATKPTLRRLDDDRRAWATLDGRYSLPALDERHDEPIAPDPVASRAPPPIHDELALLLDACPGATHADYAAALGITRPRVTQVLSSAYPERLTAPRHAGTAGHVTRWWSDAKPWDQAAAAYRWLEDNGCDPILGGDTAADALAPWRAPSATVMHVRKIVPPPSGFVAADSPQSATLSVVVDYRPSVRMAAQRLRTPAGELWVAHPLHVAADLADAAAVDERAREQAALLYEHPLDPHTNKQRSRRA